MQQRSTYWQVELSWKQLITTTSSYILAENLALGGPAPPVSSPMMFPRDSH